MGTNFSPPASAILHSNGSGYIAADFSDGTLVGGNERGANSVDWQQVRSAVTQVASGNNSVISGGINNTAAGFASYAEGERTISSGEGSHSGGVATSSGGILASSTASFA